MAELTSTNKNHQVTAFFLLTFAITWGIGIFAIFFPGQFQALFGELNGSNPIAIRAVAPAVLLYFQPGAIRAFPADLPVHGDMYFHPAYVDLQAYRRECPDRCPVPLRGEFLAFHHRCSPVCFWDDHGHTRHPGGGTG